MTLQVLMDDFVPGKLLVRKEQSEMIETIFSRYAEREPISQNAIIVGVTGAGKTFTLAQIMAKYPNHIYISAATKKKSNQIISSISGINIRRIDILLEKTINYLKEEKKILIVDELNKLQDTKTFFDDMNTIFRETKIPIILVTNNPLVVDNMAEDARNTLFFKKIIFTKYTSDDLREICMQRIRLLPLKLQSKMNEYSLGKICAIACKAGSARKALNLVRGCYLDDKFSLDFIDSLEKQEEILDFKTFVNSMSEMQRVFLTDLLYIHLKKVQESCETSFTFKDIAEKIPKLNKSKISQLITEFENDYGFIKTRYVEKGRGGGRYRKINFADEELIIKLEEAL